jgi:dihydrofolate reductase
MGRKCFESIGHALPNRENIVISRQDITFDGCLKASSLLEAISMATNEEIYIIGGGEIYEQAFPLVNQLEVTRILTKIDGDITLKGLIPSEWQLIGSSSPKKEYGIIFQFQKYVRKSLKFSKK